MNKIKFNFNDDCVVITGGARGIGLQMTHDFLSEGAHVSVWDYSEDALAALRTELKPLADRLHTFKVDISDAASCREAAAALPFKPTILINNAGITADASFKKLPAEDIDRVIGVNLIGSMQVTKALMASFSETNKSNRIINISSIVGIYGNFGQTNYAAAKAGLIGFTKSLAKELGSKGFTVNAVAPGYTATPMVKTVPSEVLEKIKNATPVRRLAEPSEISAACRFLASDGAAFINGTVLSVDGGLTL